MSVDRCRMFDLIFFSTNRTKINHFRYLGKRYKVKVKSFRELNYYASYNEPKIDNREELLRQSYYSALSQWQRRQGRNEEIGSTFFFEDTSVRIDALSKDREIPGVNIKFWMRENTFADIDEKLKDNNNNRRVSVRSDIIMHLPKKWRELLATEDEYVWVHAKVNGRIAIIDENVDLNLIYPWLDDKSFNRWFIPDGAHVPLSALSISEANKFDFRKRAFEKILLVLEKLHLIETDSGTGGEQLSLPKIENLPSIFLICGPTCSGKTTSANWMAREFSIPHIEASDFMYRAFWDRHGLKSNTKIGDFAEVALKTEPDIVATQIIEHIRIKQYACVVVTGFRALEEVEIFKAGISAERRVELIYLDADVETRLTRALSRNRDHVTPEKFLKRNVQEERMGLLRIAAEPSAQRLINDSTLPRLFSKIKAKYKRILDKQANLRNQGRFSSNLEPLIIGALASYSDSDIWLTTTEIAAALNKKYSEYKSKNNVSRYFNQGYHAYFEVRLRTTNGRESKTVEYRLSATGLSAANLMRDWLAGFASQARGTSGIVQKQLDLGFDGA